MNSDLVWAVYKKYWEILLTSTLPRLTAFKVEKKVKPLLVKEEQDGSGHLAIELISTETTDKHNFSLNTLSNMNLPLTPANSNSITKH